MITAWGVMITALGVMITAWGVIIMAWGVMIMAWGVMITAWGVIIMAWRVIIVRDLRTKSNTENSKQIFPENELCGLTLDFQTVSDLHIPTIGLAYSAAGKYVDRCWEYINSSQTLECGNWNWAAQFLFWEYINGIFVARRMRIERWPSPCPPSPQLAPTPPSPCAWAERECAPSLALLLFFLPV